MKVLLLGSGGREHALAWGIAKSRLCDQLFIAPGNGGTASLGVNVCDLEICDGVAVRNFADAHGIDLVVIGPEAPLVAGVANILRASQIPVFGPLKDWAQLEGSKTYSKEFMIKHGLPTAHFVSVNSQKDALETLNDFSIPCVIKADGLAAGKGVTVAQTREEALQAIHECFDGRFGEAGSTVVIEECLEGPECSLLALVTQGHAFCLPEAQDHKRAFDNDEGPNTGGMGVYSPVPLVSEEDRQAIQKIMQRAAAACASDGVHPDYRGVLYGGFMLTSEGPKLLEFNARFGDPETQVIIPLLENDLLSLLMGVALGNPEEIQLSWKSSWAVCVVLASKGYPNDYEKGKVITGLNQAVQDDQVVIFHAGTKLREDGTCVTAGGRVLNVVGLGETFQEARKRAYAAAEKIQFEGKFYRSDIGHKAQLEA